MKYLCYIEVHANDRILYHGEAGRVEFVASPDGEAAWYVEQYGVGCMLAVPSFGLVYVQPDEDREFVSREESH